MLSFILTGVRRSKFAQLSRRPATPPHITHSFYSLQNTEKKRKCEIHSNKQFILTIISLLFLHRARNRLNICLNDRAELSWAEIEILMTFMVLDLDSFPLIWRCCRFCGVFVWFYDRLSSPPFFNVIVARFNVTRRREGIDEGIVEIWHSLCIKISRNGWTAESWKSSESI